MSRASGLGAIRLQRRASAVVVEQRFRDGCRQPYGSFAIDENCGPEFSKTREGTLSALPGGQGYTPGSWPAPLQPYSNFLVEFLGQVSRGKWHGRFRSRALKRILLGPALHQNDLHNDGQNQNGADDGNGVIVHGPLPVYFSILAPRYRSRPCYVELFAGKVKTGPAKMAQALPERHRRCSGQYWPQRRLPNLRTSIDVVSLINHFPKERKAYSRNVLFPQPLPPHADHASELFKSKTCRFIMLKHGFSMILIIAIQREQISMRDA